MLCHLVLASSQLEQVLIGSLFPAESFLEWPDRLPFDGVGELLEHVLHFLGSGICMAARAFILQRLLELLKLVDHLLLGDHQ